MRYFQGDFVSTLGVLGFQYRSHAATTDDLDDAKAAIQHLAWPERCGSGVHGVVVFGQIVTTGNILKQAASIRFHRENPATKTMGCLVKSAQNPVKKV
jgi:hypothetical protein